MADHSMPYNQTWAEAGVSRSRSLLNFRSRSRSWSLDSFQVRSQSQSQSLGHEAETEARLFVENRSFGKPRSQSRSLWKSRSRSQALKNLGSRSQSQSLAPKKTGFVKPKPASAHVCLQYGSMRFKNIAQVFFYLIQNLLEILLSNKDLLA